MILTLEIHDAARAAFATMAVDVDRQRLRSFVHCSTKNVIFVEWRCI